MKQLLMTTVHINGKPTTACHVKSRVSLCLLANGLHPTGLLCNGLHSGGLRSGGLHSGGLHSGGLRSNGLRSSGYIPGRLWWASLKLRHFQMK